MRIITVTASRNYPVFVGSGLLDNADQLITEHIKCTNAVIISDSHVWPLYGPALRDKLQEKGLHVYHFVFPAGESSKTIATYTEILNFLAENHITRSDCLIALGGGVVGDITGFAAATFLRGIPYVQIPTTLLAMVDSSVGGKTAVDLPAGKNLVGAFYQPHLVICDICALNTLPISIFRDGCAEVIKYGILYDAGLFEHLSQNGLAFCREEVIARCIELKRDVVASDEFDTGLRQKLNLGHTFGHGIENLSNYTVSHGQAVAIGMAIISTAACQYGYCDNKTKTAVNHILQQFALPATTDFTAPQLYRAALSDKKRSGEKVNLIIPTTIGNCEILPVATNEIESFIQAGLSYGSDYSSN